MTAAHFPPGPENTPGTHQAGRGGAAGPQRRYGSTLKLCFIRCFFHTFSITDTHPVRSRGGGQSLSLQYWQLNTVTSLTLLINPVSITTGDPPDCLTPTGHISSPVITPNLYKSVASPHGFVTPSSSHPPQLADLPSPSTGALAGGVPPLNQAGLAPESLQEGHPASPGTHKGICASVQCCLPSATRQNLF